MGIEAIRETTESCKHCFMCRHACPTFLATKLDSHTPRGYALLLSEIDHGYQEFTASIVERYYQCSQCGLCREDCAYHWAEDEVVRHAREEIVFREKVPQRVQKLADAVKTHRTPFGDEQSGWPEDLPRNTGAAIIYFAGCSTRQNQPEIIRSVAKILNHLGVDWSVLETEGCCGTPLYELGYTQEAREAAVETAGEIAKAKPKILLTGCAHCFRAFKEFYPKWGVDLPQDLQILHTSQYLSQTMAEEKLKLSSQRIEAAYHDPCQLGRKMKEFEAPRKLIEAATGKPAKELYHEREAAECCGSGSVMFLTDPHIAGKVAAKRTEALAETGCQTLITACQNCKHLFLSRPEANRIDVLDISELVARSIAD